MTPTAGTGIVDVLYVVEHYTADFETVKATVDIVCVGDSLTGWNHFGPVEGWPFATYPSFLQELCAPLGWQVANGGIAGEISDNGPQQVRDYHNPRLKAFCEEHGIPLADICALLHDEHFGDELHPNGRGAKIIGEAVFQVLPKE